VKTYGVACRFPSRSNHHNCYKEYRDLTVCGAISQLYMELASRHRIRRKDVAIIRVGTTVGKEGARRKDTKQYFDSKIKVPSLRRATRPENPAFKTIFKAARPSTIYT
jgi:large subunit ribosomal protein L18Ae